MFCLSTGAKYPFFQDPAHGLYWRLKKISYRACLHFSYFFGDKKQLLRALLTYTFIRLLLNSFDLRSQFKIEKNIHIQAVMLLMRLEVLREGFFCFPLRDWEGVCWKLLSLVSLNFEFLAKMLNFIFIKVTWKLGI